MATGGAAPFQPLSTAAIAASTSPASGSVTPADSVLIYNAAAATAFVAVGGGTASAASTPVPPGGRQLFAAGMLVGRVSVILASGTGTVYATSGQGSAY